MISALRQNSNFKLFWKKNQIFGFLWCSTREDLSIDVSITNVGLILTKLRWFLFSGYGHMNRQTRYVLESSYRNMSAHKKFQLKISGQLSIPTCLPGGRGCINIHSYNTQSMGNRAKLHIQIVLIKFSSTFLVKGCVFTNYYCRTDIDESRVISALQHMSLKYKSKLKKKNWFPCCSTREDLSTDVSISYYCRNDIDRARVIQHFGISQNSISTFYEKKIFGFPCCSTHKDLSIDV